MNYFADCVRSEKRLEGYKFSECSTVISKLLKKKVSLLLKLLSYFEQDTVLKWLTIDIIDPEPV